MPLRNAYPSEAYCAFQASGDLGMSPLPERASSELTRASIELLPGKLRPYPQR